MLLKKRVYPFAEKDMRFPAKNLTDARKEIQTPGKGHRNKLPDSRKNNLIHPLIGFKRIQQKNV